MTPTPERSQGPGNLGGGGASSAPLHTLSSSHRRRWAPIYNRRHRHGPQAHYGPRRKRERRQPGLGPWSRPPLPWGCCGGPWGAPLGGFRQRPGRAQRLFHGAHPLCLSCCVCWLAAAWGRAWERPPGQRKRWGRRGRDPRRSSRRRPRRRPGRLHEWREPGLRAPHNTTQFIMNQIYEDMRQQEKQKRQQAALQAQQAFPGGGGGEEDAKLWETSYRFAQNPALAISPEPRQEDRSPTPRLVAVKEEEEEKNEAQQLEEEECDEEAESEEEDDDDEGTEADEEQGETGEEEKGLPEENPLPLDTPSSILAKAEEERQNFLNYVYMLRADGSRSAAGSSPPVRGHQLLDQERDGGMGWNSLTTYLKNELKLLWTFPRTRGCFCGTDYLPWPQQSINPCMERIPHGQKSTCTSS